MKLSPHVRLVSRDGQDEDGFDPGSFPVVSADGLDALLRRAILTTRHWLLTEQQPEGYWAAELEGDTILESEAILLWAWLGEERSPLAAKAARYILDKQLPDGGWALYPGGEVDVSASVKAYFALKLTGYDASAEPLARARRAILAAGGADRVNSFTRFYLALLGQIDWDRCPEVPPEVVLFPSWMPLSMYHVSAWSRTIIVPLSIISALRPVRHLPPQFGVRELFIQSPEHWPPLRVPGDQSRTGFLSWDRLFRLADSALRLCRKVGFLPLRRLALARAEAWMLERFEGSDGLGAIFPPIVWSIIALKCLGHSDESPEVEYCRRQLAALVIEEEETARLEPCKSPVWDTALSVRALAASGLAGDHPSLQRAARWLLQKEVRRRGDWARTVVAEPSGWCFEHNNEFYPDLDDTAMVLLALRAQWDPERESALLPPGLSVAAYHMGSGEHEEYDKRDERDRRDPHDAARLLEETLCTARRAVAWTLAMQNNDGGWGAFDRNNNYKLLCHVPFADHNAMIDPSSPDLTARVLEALAQWGYGIRHPAACRAIDYLRRTQEPDGSWYGRWGVNYIYGTWQALVGLREIGLPPDDPAIVAGAGWLLAYQQPCGGWGESPDSYANSSLRGEGPVTASQTAWAILGLMAAGMAEHPAVERGVRYLVGTQSCDGTWNEPEFTGTGFPLVFYLRYHMYPIYFPLLALSTWAGRKSGRAGGRMDEA